MMVKTKSQVLEEINRVVMEAFEKQEVYDVTEQNRMILEILKRRMEVEPKLVADSLDDFNPMLPET